MLRFDELYTYKSFFYPAKKNYKKLYTPPPNVLSSSLKIIIKNLPPTLFPSIFSNTKNSHHNNHNAFRPLKK